MDSPLIYTTHGAMTPADLAEVRADYDLVPDASEHECDINCDDECEAAAEAYGDYIDRAAERGQDDALGGLDDETRAEWEWRLGDGGGDDV